MQHGSGCPELGKLVIQRLSAVFCRLSALLSSFGALHKLVQRCLEGGEIVLHSFKQRVFGRRLHGAAVYYGFTADKVEAGGGDEGRKGSVGVYLKLAFHNTGRERGGKKLYGDLGSIVGRNRDAAVLDSAVLKRGRAVRAGKCGDYPAARKVYGAVSIH